MTPLIPVSVNMLTSLTAHSYKKLFLDIRRISSQILSRLNDVLACFITKFSQNKPFIYSISDCFYYIYIDFRSIGTAIALHKINMIMRVSQCQ